MPGAWTAGVRTRPKAVRVIRERERRDKWQSVSSWMRIGAPYRCHSFVCGPHIVVRPPESREKDRANVLPLLLLLLPLYRCCDLLLLSFRATLYVWESDSPWILGDVLTAGWRAIVPSLYLPVAFFFSLPPPPSFLFFIVFDEDPSPFHATFRVAPINEHTFSGPWWTPWTWNINRLHTERRERDLTIDPTVCPICSRESAYILYISSSPLLPQQETLHSPQEALNFVTSSLLPLSFSSREALQLTTRPRTKRPIQRRDNVGEGEGGFVSSKP